MEVARDIQDHQLVDRDDQPCGRVDDVVIEWDDAGARLGALLSGGGVLLDQLGVVGRVLKRVVPHERTRSHLAIEWRQVRAFEPHHIGLLPPRDRIGERRVSEPGAGSDGRRLFTALLQTPVIDSKGDRMDILDVRTRQPRLPAEPRVSGLLCMRSPRLALLGLKRHDGGLIPQPRLTKQARFVPWEVVQSVSADAVHLDALFEDLPGLSEMRESPPPAIPENEAE